MSIRVIKVTDDRGAVIEPEWLARSEPVLRQLRPKIEWDYAAKMQRIFQSGGRMCVAIDQDAVRGVAIFRVFENTFSDRRFYVDDLCIDEAHRSKGIGHAMIEYLEHEASTHGCNSIELESGTHRLQAHKFYFREGFLLTSFSFRKEL